MKKPISYWFPEGHGLVKHSVTLLQKNNLTQVLKEESWEVTDVTLLAAMWSF